MILLISCAMLMKGDWMNENIGYFYYQSVTDTALGESDNHYHSNYEIYYLTEGRCRYFIDKHSYLITKGDVALIPPGVIHRTGYETPTHSRKLINCGEWFVPKALRNKLFNPVSFSDTSSTHKQIEQIFTSIEKEQSSPDEFSRDAIRAQVVQLLLLIARKSRVSEQKKIESPIVEKAVQYISKQYRGNVTLDNVAAVCYVSKEHLSRTFKRETGFGFSEYLNLYRLKKADTLLRDRPDLRIVDIAIYCGYNDSNYFSKVYKKMFGISPKQAQKG